MSFEPGVLIVLFAYIFLTMGAFPSIYIVDLEKPGVLEHRSKNTRGALAPQAPLIDRSLICIVIDI